MREVFVCMLALSALPFLASSGLAGDNWLLGDRWVEVDRPCAIEANGESRLNGTTYLPERVIMRSPAEWTLNAFASTLKAGYSIGTEEIRVEIDGAPGHTYQLLFKREGELIVDGSGFRYRRCHEASS